MSDRRRLEPVRPAPIDATRGETGALTDLEVMAPFLQHALGDPAVWAEQDSLVRDTTARLFLQGFVRFYLAVKLPLANDGRPLRIDIVSAE